MQCCFLVRQPTPTNTTPTKAYSTVSFQSPEELLYFVQKVSFLVFHYFFLKRILSLELE